MITSKSMIRTSYMSMTESSYYCCHFFYWCQQYVWSKTKFNIF